MTGTVAVGSRHVLDRPEFPALLAALRSAGYRVVGPTVRDGAIVYGEIREESDLPVGWTDRQDAGKYRLERRADAALFGYNVGPHSWKKYLFPARERLWTAVRKDDSFEVQPATGDPTPLAFLGVRACELAAMGISDRVFGKAGDTSYLERRNHVLRIAVQCGLSRWHVLLRFHGNGARGAGRTRPRAHGGPSPGGSLLRGRGGLRGRCRGPQGPFAPTGHGRRRGRRHGDRGEDRRLDGPRDGPERAP